MVVAVEIVGSEEAVATAKPPADISDDFKVVEERAPDLMARTMVKVGLELNDLEDVGKEVPEPLVMKGDSRCGRVQPLMFKAVRKLTPWSSSTRMRVP